MSNILDDLFQFAAEQTLQNVVSVSIALTTKRGDDKYCFLWPI
jgi:hypothetical protein